MLARIRRTFFPRLEIEQRAFRRRVVQTTLRGAFVILGVWLVVEAALVLTSSLSEGHAVALDAAAMIILLLVVALAWRWVRRDRFVAIGYLLSTAALAYPALNLFVAPGDMYLVNPVLIISVLIAGTMVGPAAGYLFAAMAIVVNAASWFYARSVVPSGAVGFDAASGSIFVLVQSLVALSAAAVLDAIGSHIDLTIGRLNRQAGQMSELAHTDPLTGLANRRWFMDQLDREVARARRHNRPLSLIYIDLDGFKAINDRFGHLFGDDILRGVSRSMGAILRSTDLLARIGGDEFAVVLPETNETGAANVNQKLRKAVAAYAAQFGAALPSLTFCAGIARLRPGDTTIDDVLARADEAQYLAKSTGKDHTRSEDELTPAAPPPA
ncbi:MAG TPA: GGDEF domain-containing protein [Anaerolineales bacterium]|nr:GGDEF domain-containing protein [Anaerolineales bacterium]